MDQKSKDQDPPAVHRGLLAKRCGITDPDEADRLAGAIESKYNVRGDGFLITAAGNGTLPRLVAEARDGIAARQQATEPLPAGVHAFQPATNPDDTDCAQCSLPRTNRHHYRPAAPNWDISIHDQRYAAQAARRNGRRPHRNDDYTDADYGQPL